MSHNLKLLAVSRYGCWATCTCEWRSKEYVSQEGAQWAFGNHLTESASPEPTAP